MPNGRVSGGHSQDSRSRSTQLRPGLLLRVRPIDLEPSRENESFTEGPGRDDDDVMNGIPNVPPPANEPVVSYAPGTPERARLKASLAELAGTVTDIPLWIGGDSVHGTATEVVMPHDHQRVVGRASNARPEHVLAAIEAAERARPEWAALSQADRSAVFLKAADLLTGPFRDRINAATMLGQSKTCHQAEIEAACELADFWRFNVAYAHQLMQEQPLSPPGLWNQTELRPLDGFVFAVTPFNFTAIAGNLPTAPALMGNTSIWKPAPSQILSAHVIVEILQAAGLPPGVVNLVAGEPAMIGETVLADPRLAGLHFTGSTATFCHLWSTIGQNIRRYRQYPRIVGETGGKDFIFAHPSADLVALTAAIVRGGFEYQGQKCSAASRIYIPRSIWPELKDRLTAEIGTIKVGDVQDFSNFMGAVINAAAFRKVTGYVDLANSDPACSVLAGGTYNGDRGYFVMPTLVEAHRPDHRLMTEEIFGPVVTVFVYDDDQEAAALDRLDQDAPYGLTGAIFAQDRRHIQRLSERLRFTAGNFYINDKPTGAVVGQQPFGGSRASGTNDKAGSPQNLLRWVSTRAIKETFVPATNYRYPFLQEP